MENEEKNSPKTLLIVLVVFIAILLIIGLVFGVWFGLNYLRDQNKDSTATKTDTTETETETKTEETKATPNELPTTAAENFIKSIFNTFPGSSVNLTKANGYLGSSLKTQVGSTKESYWDLHGYIHSGPCSVSVLEISKTDTTAVVEITTEWGSECMGLSEPYYRYNMSVSGDKWLIDSISQLKPQTDETEMVPRDF